MLTQASGRDGTLIDNSRSSIFNLPPEILHPILSHLEIPAFFALKHTCRSSYYSLGVSMPEDDVVQERLKFEILVLMDRDPILKGKGVCHLCRRLQDDQYFSPTIFSERVCVGCTGTVDIMFGLRLTFSQFSKFRLLASLEQSGRTSDRRWSRVEPKQLQGLKMEWERKIGTNTTRLSFQNSAQLRSKESFWNSRAPFHQALNSLIPCLRQRARGHGGDPLHMKSMGLARTHQEYLDIRTADTKLFIEGNDDTILSVTHCIQWIPSNRPIPDDNAFVSDQPVEDTKDQRHKAPCICPHISLDGSKLPPASSRWRDPVLDQKDMSSEEEISCRICNTVVTIRDLSPRFYTTKRFLGGRMMSLEVKRNLGKGKLASDPAWLRQLTEGDCPSSEEILRTKYLYFIGKLGSIEQLR